MNRREFLEKLVSGFVVAGAASKVAFAQDSGFSFVDGGSLVDENRSGPSVTQVVIDDKPDKRVSSQPTLPTCTTETEKERLARLEEQCNYTHKPGWHSKKSPIVGIYADVFDKYLEFALQNPAFRRFGHAAYMGWIRDALLDMMSPSPFDGDMIPKKYAPDAEKVSYALYKEILSPYAKYGLTPDNAVLFTDNKTDRVETMEVEDCENTWHLEVRASIGWAEPTERDRYLSGLRYLIAVHELGHVKRMRKRASRDFPPSLICVIPEMRIIEETAVAITDIILYDYVRKIVEGLPINSVVEYERKVPSDSGDGIPLGVVANTFRNLRVKYGTIEQALMSGEGQRFVLKDYMNTST